MNEHALKAATDIHDYVERCPEGEFSMVGLAEIIIRTALEPATKELREALQTIVNNATMFCVIGAKRTNVYELSIDDIEKVKAVLTKYPAKEQR